MHIGVQHERAPHREQRLHRQCHWRLGHRLSPLQGVLGVQVRAGGVPDGLVADVQTNRPLMMPLDFFDKDIGTLDLISWSLEFSKWHICLNAGGASVPGASMHGVMFELFSQHDNIPVMR